jgi:uncharacterized membrane protein
MALYVLAFLIGVIAGLRSVVPGPGKSAIDAVRQARQRCWQR